MRLETQRTKIPLRFPAATAQVFDPPMRFTLRKVVLRIPSEISRPGNLFFLVKRLERSLIRQQMIEVPAGGADLANQLQRIDLKIRRRDQALVIGHLSADWPRLIPAALKRKKRFVVS